MTSDFSAPLDTQRQWKRILKEMELCNCDLMSSKYSFKCEGIMKIFLVKRGLGILAGQRHPKGQHCRRVFTNEKFQKLL